MNTQAEKLEIVRLLFNTNKKSTLKAVKSILSKDMDETEYLLSSQANKLRLGKSMNHADEGKYQFVDLNKLWK